MRFNDPHNKGALLKISFTS